jgi:hypothetical protein
MPAFQIPVEDFNLLVKESQDFVQACIGYLPSPIRVTVLVRESLLDELTWELPYLYGRLEVIPATRKARVGKERVSYDLRVRKPVNYKQYM